MPRDSGGTYTVPAGTAGVAGAIIDPVAYDNFLTDLSSNVTTSLPTTGVKGMGANLPMGGFLINNLGTPVATTDAATKAYVDTATGPPLIFTGILQGFLGGCGLSNDGGSPLTVIDIAAGVAMSDDVTTVMKLSALTKTMGSWAVGTGVGSLDTGAVAVNTWYHIYVIERTDTGVVDILASVSPTSPTMPANYTKKRRIGSIRTAVSTTNILAFSQNGNEFLWLVAISDFGPTPVSTGPVAITLSTPLGVITNAMVSVALSSGSGGGITYTLAPAAMTGSPSIPCLISNNLGQGIANITSVRTGTSSAVQGFAGTASGNIQVRTYGWIDTRGQG